MDSKFLHFFCCLYPDWQTWLDLVWLWPLVCNTLKISQRGSTNQCYFLSWWRTIGQVSIIKHICYLCSSYLNWLIKCLTQVRPRKRGFTSTRERGRPHLILKSWNILKSLGKWQELHQILRFGFFIMWLPMPFCYVLKAMFWVVTQWSVEKLAIFYSLICARSW